MRTYHKIPLVVSLFVLVGVPIMFLFISLATKQWNYLLFSLPPSLVAGLTGLMITLNQMKKAKIDSVEKN